MAITRKKAVVHYKRIARELDALHSEASNHISRQDNNRVFEISRFLRDVSSRIKQEYDLPIDDPYFTRFT